MIHARARACVCVWEAPTPKWPHLQNEWRETRERFLFFFLGGGGCKDDARTWRTHTSNVRVRVFKLLFLRTWTKRILRIAWLRRGASRAQTSSLQACHSATGASQLTRGRMIFWRAPRLTSSTECTYLYTLCWHFASHFVAYGICTTIVALTNVCTNLMPSRRYLKLCHLIFFTFWLPLFRFVFVSQAQQWQRE